MAWVSSVVTVGISDVEERIDTVEPVMSNGGTDVAPVTEPPTFTDCSVVTLSSVVVCSVSSVVLELGANVVELGIEVVEPLVSNGGSNVVLDPMSTIDDASVVASSPVMGVGLMAFAPHSYVGQH